eukprot:TRINITY_DN15953_c0_g1_i2.p1 TRINITY_DN15953_c0_g1~~TRINITY_DN15953_c0_g1_i2.p1  ORF type:complete len:588 (+),score=135.55 TRINITY_DN15953_c0_g1_i2:77-1765(+)
MEPPIPKFNLDVIHTLRELQQQHGLKSFDYQRYRQYCTRRLRRIHKTVKMFAGTQKKYKGLVIQPEDVTDTRILMILLLQAERAWAYGEQLKYDHSTTDAPRLHRHYALKMAKAVAHAQKLLQITKYVANERTITEVEAYTNEILGHFHVSKKDYSAAKDSYLKARKVYVSQQESSTPMVKAAYLQRISDLDQNMRFCNYNLGDDATAQTETLQAGGSSGVLKWRGKTISVNSEKVRLQLATAEQATSDISSQLEKEAEAITASMLNKIIDMYDKAFIAYNDAIQQVKQDIAHEKETDSATLHLLVNGLKYNLLEHTLARNKLMSRVHTARLEDSSQQKKESKRTTALDLARLHDTVTQTIEGMLAIPGVEDDDALANPLNLQLLVHQALKYFCQAETFTNMREYGHAQPLYLEAEKLISEGLIFCRTAKIDDSEVVAEGEKVRAAKCRSKAAALLSEEASVPEVAVAKTRLDKSFVEYRPCESITRIPPDYVSIPCRPVFFDLARQCIEKPSFSHRLVGTKGGAKPSIASKTTPKPTAQATAQGGDKKGWFNGWSWGKKPE